jgi:hypothetical protein
VEHLTTTTIAGPIAAQYHLQDAGTPAPTLYPNIHVPDLGYSVPYRWSGWNRTEAVGLDANSNPVMIGLWHYASGHTHYAVEGPFVRGATLSSKPAAVFDQLAWPLEVLPAVAVILHPQWTPDADGRPVDLPGWRSGVATLRDRMARTEHAAEFDARVDAITLGRW